ncbi:hypothetical protein Bcep1808_2718 [Burkholderia vietnamiensis G4]|uniref:Uncharacterized protein n=1 Tax=Burkholderia vietnamiensis (strain G4 / LMG 22486) TaxID=269482 RepID=A4JHF6_BURVG|nr:hypothetical protein Bcep1808_2718 [Burkholderia vietnamiensis G4]
MSWQAGGRFTRATVGAIEDHGGHDGVAGTVAGAVAGAVSLRLELQSTPPRAHATAHEARRRLQLMNAGESIRPVTQY